MLIRGSIPARLTSHLLRRSYSAAAGSAASSQPGTSARSYIPPNIGNIAAISSAGTSVDVSDIKPLMELYKRLPKGALPKHIPADKSKTGTMEGFWESYREKYFQRGRESPMPLLHVVLAFFLFAYSFSYATHLSHHKNRKYH